MARRRSHLWLAAAASVLAVVSCGRGATRDPMGVIVPPGGSATGADSAGSPVAREESIPIVSIDRADRLIALLTISPPSAEEGQIIAVQRRDDPGAPVRILVAGREGSRGRQARVAWEAQSSATVASFFSLSIDDLLGDHGLVIVARGMNAEGRFTLDAFRRSPLAQAGEFTFRQICRITGDEITIEQIERPPSYSSGQKNGLPFTIVSYLRDPGSANPMDLIRTAWTWKYAENRYVAEPPEKIPGERVSQEQLQQLFLDLRPQAFEAFLAGPWVERPAGDPKRGTEVVEFQPAARRIAICAGDTIELFIWRDTVRTLSDRVVIVAANEVVPKIRRTFSVRAAGISEIVMSTRGDDGTTSSELSFTRAADRPRAGSATPPAARAGTPLSGEYLGPGGLVVRFTAGTLQWRESGGERQGAWLTFALDGRKVLSVRFLDDALPRERSWLADLSEKRVDREVVRSLTLSPVTLTVRGWDEGPGDPIVLRQVVQESAPGASEGGTN